jgi:hypothetical protein
VRGEVNMVDVERNKLGKAVEDYRCSCGHLHTSLFCDNLPLKRCYRCGKKDNWK